MAAESAAQLFARLGAKQNLEGLDSCLFSDISNGLQAGDVVEFYGKEGCGKTEMLIHLIANCILPKNWKHLTLGGRGVCVIMVDTDFHFQLLRLISVLEHRILNVIRQSADKSESNQGDCSASDHSEIPEKYQEGFHEFIKSCLTRLYIVRCSSSIQLLATLLSLENLIAAKPEVAVLMIDSIGAFYWLDKCCGGESQTDQELNLKKTVDVLQKYVKEYHLVLIATKHAIFGSADKAHHEYLCPAWRELVDYRFVFDRDNAGHVMAAGTKPIYSARRLCRPHTKVHRFYIQEGGVIFI